MTPRSHRALKLVAQSLFLLALPSLATLPARANLFSLAVSGTISANTTGDPTIPVGTPFNFQLTYDAVAPDLAPSDLTFGSFANTTAPPALVFFHYQAGSYEATLDDPADFGTFSQMVITFTSVHAIDININAPTLFPHLAGGPVSFHADFNAFSQAPIFSSDALPTNTSINLASFDESTVTLLPPAGVVTTSSFTSLTLAAVQQPTVAGDFNNNGTVDAADYTIWRDNLGTMSSLPNDNGIGGIVRQLHYDLWRNHFGESFAGGAASLATAAVPEPAALVLLMIAAIPLTKAVRLSRLLSV